MDPRRWHKLVARALQGSRRPGRRPAGRRPALRLELESLEQRAVPATHTWTGSQSALWSNANNWSGGSPAGDNAPTIVFPNSGVTTKTSTNDLAGAISIQTIEFDDNGFTLSSTGSASISLVNSVITTNTNGTNTISCPMNLSTSGTTPFIVGGTGTLAISGTLGGVSGGGLSKAGTGTMVLSGANTYGGGAITSITNGIIVAQTTTALGNSQVNVTQSGAALQIQGGIKISNPLTLNGTGVGGAGAVESLAGTNTLAGGISVATSDATIGVDAATLTVTGAISGVGGLTKVGAGTLVLQVANSFQGTAKIQEGIVNIQDGKALGTSAGGAIVSNGAVLQMQGSITVDTPLNLAGTGINTSGALQSVSGNNTISNLSTVTMASADATIRIDAGQLTINGTITGPGGLTKSGVAPLILGGANPNNFVGTTTVVNGELDLTKVPGANAIPGQLVINTTVKLKANDQISDTSAVTINAGAVLDLNNFSDTIGTLTMTAGTAQTGNGLLTLGGDVTTTATSSPSTITGNLSLGSASRNFTIGSGAGPDLVVTAVVSGGSGVGFTKLGAGTMVLQAFNNFTGAVNVNAGILDLQNGNALGNINTGTTVNAGGTLELEGDITVPESLTLNGNGVAGRGALRSLSGNNFYLGAIALGSANVNIGVDAGTLEIDGQISGLTSGLTKVGAGQLTLPNANLYNGVTSVNAGTLEIQNGLALGPTASAVTVANGATLQVDSGITVNKPLTITGAGVGGAGALESVTGSNAFTASVVISGNSTIGVDAGQLTLSGVVSGGGALTKVGAGTLDLAGTASNTNAGVVTVADGTLLLNKSTGNAIAGTLVIGDGVGAANTDVVRLLASNQIADNAAVTINSDGLLDLNGSSDTVGPLVFVGGNVTTGAGTLTLTGDITAQAASASAMVSGHLSLGTAPRTIAVASGAAPELVISAVLSGGAGVGLTKTGTGTLVLSGVNTYSGPTQVNAGTVNIQSNQALGDPNADTTIAAGAALQVQGNISSAEPLNLSGTGVSNKGVLESVSGTNTFTGTVNFAADVTVGVDAGQLTLGNVVSGPGALTKVGAGTLLLQGVNTFQGATTVGAGAVIAASSQALGNTGALVSVTAGAALQLTGGVTITNPLSLNGTGLAGKGALENLSGPNTASGGVTLNAPTVVVGVDAGGLTLSGVVSGAGNLSTVGAGNLTLAGTNPNTYTGTTTVNGGFLVLGKNPGVTAVPGDLIVNATAQLTSNDQIADTSTVSVNLGAHLDLNNHNDAIGPLNLTGGAVTTGTGTLTLGGDVTDNAAAQAALIDGKLALGAATRTITVAPNVAPELTISAVISSGAGVGIVKAGGGTLVLAGGNTYQGTTQVQGGTLNVQNGLALGSPAAGTVVSNGASLQVQGNVNLLEPLTLVGIGTSGAGVLENVADTNSFSGPVVMASADATLGVDDGQLTIAGPISGGGGLTKVGSGTLVLSGNSANSYAGPTTVVDDLLVLAKLPATVAIPGPLTIGDNRGLSTAAVRLDASDQIATVAPVTVNSTGVLDLNNHSNALGALTIAGGIVQTGTGTLTLAGDLTTQGSAKPAQITGNLSVGNKVRTFTVADGTAPVDLLVSAVLSGGPSGGVVKAGPGTMQLAGTTSNTLAGAITVNAGVLDLGKTGGAVAVAGSLTLNGTGRLSANNEIGDGATVTVNGTGILDLNGKSDTIGGLTLSGGTVNTGAGTLTLAGDLASLANAASATINGNLGLTGAINFTIADGPAAADLVVNAIISGTGASLTKAGAGTLRFAGTADNTYDGTTTVSAGTLELGKSAGVVAVPGALSAAGTVRLLADNQVADGAGITLNGGTFDLNNLSDTVGGLNLTAGDIETETGVLTIGGDITTNAASKFSLIQGTLNLGGATRTVTVADGPVFQDFDLSANVVGTGAGLIKAGPGKLFLIGNDTYDGGTVVNAGSAVVIGKLGAGTVTVNSGAVLTGIGTVGTVSVAAGGKLDPGQPTSNSIAVTGVFTVNSGLTLVPQGTLTVDVNGINPGTLFDQIVVKTGTVDLGGATLAINLNVPPTFGSSLTLIDNQGTSPVKGTFAGLPEGALTVINNVPLQITYAGGTGNDVVLKRLNAGQAFVAKLYQDLLHRAVDQGGLTFWVGLLNKGVPRIQVVAQMENTTEYHRVEVNDLYLALLKHAADGTALGQFGTQLDAGTPVENVEAQILGTDEYFKTRGSSTDNGWLGAVYTDVLNRALDQAGIDMWGPHLKTETRAQVAAEIMATREADQVDVNRLYQQFLHRQADPGGLNTFTNLLQSGASRTAVIPPLAASDEYFSFNQAFVAVAYQDLLLRPATPSELTFWANKIATGTSTQSVATSILTDPEYKGVVADQLFNTLLHRAPTAKERSDYANFLLSGGTLEQAKSVILSGTEYFQVRGQSKNDVWLNAVYTDLLGRPVDPTGKQVFLNALASGVSRQQVANTILASVEYRQVLVKGYYQTYLRRAADAGGLNNYVNALGAGHRDEEVIASLIGSAEYFAKL